jgi:hypothetical protein
MAMPLPASTKAAAPPTTAIPTAILVGRPVIDTPLVRI